MTAGWVMVAGGRLDEATQEVGTGLELARGMSASRFEPFLMESEARVAWQRGDHAGAERIILDAYDLVERMQLHGFIGAWVLGTVALFARDAAVRKRALLKGAACLTSAPASTPTSWPPTPCTSPASGSATTST
jgi:hypothetical protein